MISMSGESTISIRPETTTSKIRLTTCFSTVSPQLRNNRSGVSNI